MKYRRKPIIVEAEQFDPNKKPWPTGVEELKANWKGQMARDGGSRFHFFGAALSKIQVGDWVVTCPGGARYVVPMFDFHDFYEVITEKDLASG